MPMEGQDNSGERSEATSYGDVEAPDRQWLESVGVPERTQASNRSPWQVVDKRTGSESLRGRPLHNYCRTSWFKPGEQKREGEKALCVDGPFIP